MIRLQGSRKSGLGAGPVWPDAQVPPDLRLYTGSPLIFLLVGDLDHITHGGPMDFPGRAGVQAAPQSCTTLLASLLFHARSKTSAKSAAKAEPAPAAPRRKPRWPFFADCAAMQPYGTHSKWLPGAISSKEAQLHSSAPVTRRSAPAPPRGIHSLQARPAAGSDQAPPASVSPSHAP